MKKIGDLVRVQQLFPTVKDWGASAAMPAQSATIYSPAFQLGKDQEYALNINVQHISSVGPRAPVTAKLVVGTTTYASPTAYTSLATLPLATIVSSGATQTQVNWAQIIMTGTATKVGTAFAGVIIDNATFTFSATADSSVIVHTTSCSGAAAKLSTAIRSVCTYLDSTYYALGVTTGPGVVEVWPKDGNRTFNITSTSIYPGASADGLGIIFAKSGLYEFKAEDIEAASTVAYTHFAVRLNSTGTVARLSGSLLAGGARYRPNINIDRQQLATVSSAYSS